MTQKGDTRKKIRDRLRRCLEDLKRADGHLQDARALVGDTHPEIREAMDRAEQALGLTVMGVGVIYDRL